MDDTGTHRSDSIRVCKYTQQPIPILIRVAYSLHWCPSYISLDQAGHLGERSLWVAHADH